jgi:hypothetical protein
MRRNFTNDERGSLKMSEAIKEAMRTMMQAARESSMWMLEGLPREATTEGQRILQEQHGTPYEFGQSCINALDMISPKEAKEAIDRYRREWEAAR